MLTLISFTLTGSNKLYIRNLYRSRFVSLFEDNIHLYQRKEEVQWNKLIKSSVCGSQTSDVYAEIRLQDVSFSLNALHMQNKVKRRRACQRISIGSYSKNVRKAQKESYSCTNFLHDLGSYYYCTWGLHTYTLHVPITNLYFVNCYNKINKPLALTKLYATFI